MQILISQEKNVNHLNRQDYSPPSSHPLLSEILENVASAHTGEASLEPSGLQEHPVTREA